MKTFSQIISSSESENVNTEFPTFSEAISGELEEGFTGKDKVSASFEKLHALQLELQEIEKQLLTFRDQFLAIPTGSPDRDALKPQMIALSKKKAEIEKTIKNAEVETQRAIASDDMEIEELDIF